MLGNLRVHLEDRWQEDSVAVYVLDGKPARRILRLERVDAMADAIRRLGGGREPSDTVGPRVRYTWQDLDPGVEPTLILDIDLLDAIVDARAQVRPADTGATEALTDTRHVRDRLLGLVERIVDADIAREAR